MFLKTSVSCAAKPFTVFTRFGIRSARRCSATSTVLHAAVTASRCVTRSLRTLTYLLHAIIPASASTMSMIKPIFTCSLLFTHLVHGVDYRRDPLHIGCQQTGRIYIARLDPLLAEIEQPVERLGFDPEPLSHPCDRVPLG